MSEKKNQDYAKWFATQGGLALKKQSPKDYYKKLAKKRWEKEKEKEEITLKIDS